MIRKSDINIDYIKNWNKENELEEMRKKKAQKDKEVKTVQLSSHKASGAFAQREGIAGTESNAIQPKKEKSNKITFSKINFALESHKNDFDFVNSLGTGKAAKVTPVQSTSPMARISNAGTSIIAKPLGELKSNVKLAVKALTPTESDKYKKEMFALSSKYGTQAFLMPEYMAASRNYQNALEKEKTARNNEALKATESAEDYKRFREAALQGLTPKQQKLGNFALGAGDLALNLASGVLAVPMMVNESMAERSRSEALNGKLPEEALGSGTLSGGVTAATTYLPTKAFSKIGGIPSETQSLAHRIATGTAKGTMNEAGYITGLAKTSVPTMAKTIGKNMLKGGAEAGTISTAGYLGEGAVNKALGYDSGLTVPGTLSSFGQGFMTGAALKGVRGINDAVKLRTGENRVERDVIDWYNQNKFMEDLNGRFSNTHKMIGYDKGTAADFVNDMPQNNGNINGFGRDTVSAAEYGINRKQKTNNMPDTLTDSQLTEKTPAPIAGLIRNTAQGNDVKNVKNLEVATPNEISTFVKQAKINSNNSQYMNIGPISDRLRTDLNSAGINVEGYVHALRDNDIRHIEKSHGNLSSNKYKVTDEDFLHINDIVKDYDNLYLGYKTKSGNNAVVYEKTMRNRTFYVEEVLSDGVLGTKQMLKVGNKSIPSFLKKYKKINGIPETDVTVQDRATGQSPLGNHVQNAGNTADIIISRSGENINRYGGGTVGAAEYNPDSLGALADRYGAIKEGEEPRARIGVVPKSIDNSGQKVSQFARTAIEAGATPESFVSEIEKGILEGKFSHTVITDKNASDYANGFIERQGFANSLNYWNTLISENKAIGKKDMSLGLKLYNEAANAGDYKTAKKIIGDIAAQGTQSGQAVQALRLLKKMDPDGNLYSLEITVQKLNNIGKGVKTRTGKPVEIKEELAEKLLKSKNTEEMNRNVEIIKDDIAKQLKTSLMEKWNEWRYTAMLANPTTHIRNIVGNAATKAMYSIKDDIGAVLESAGDYLSKSHGNGGLEYKTKSFFNPASKSDRQLLEYAKNDYDKYMKGVISGKNKFNDKSDILSRRDTFGTTKVGKLLNKISDLNSKALDAEDNFFIRQNYSMSLAKYMKANKYTPEYLNSFNGQQAFDRARDYAAKEALESTFHDDSKVADKINEFQRLNIGTDIIVGGVLPFKKTPINIMKRSYEYSPFSLLKGTVKAVRANDNDTMVNAMNDLAKGLTGTGLLMFGAWLASEGILSSLLSDDRKMQALEKAEGKQGLALNVADKSISLDFAAPTAVPILMGAALYNSMRGTDNSSKFDLFGAIASIAEPVTQMTMLSSLQNMIDDVRFGESAPLDILQSVGKSYIGSGMPTVFGKVANTIDDTQRSTYIDKNSNMSASAQKILQGIQYKTPFINQSLPPTLDVWGRETKTGSFPSKVFNNFINPSTVKDINETEVDNEVKRLYSVTGDSGVMSSKPSKYFGQGEGRYDLSAEEYTEYVKKSNSASYSDISNILNNQEYKKLGDSDKADIIKGIYEFNRDIAKHSINSSFPLSSSSVNILKAERNGISKTGYMLIKQECSNIDSTDAENKAELKYNKIFESDYSPEQKGYLAEIIMGKRENPIDFTDKESFVVSQMSEAAQKHWPEMKRLGYTPEEYNKYYSILKGKGKKKDKCDKMVAELQLTKGLPSDMAYDITYTLWNEIY